VTAPERATFAMVVAVRPISANARPQQSRWYTHRLQAEAIAHGRFPLPGPLYVRIVWFQLQRSPGDVDNIARRILDSLKGIVFQDDRAIDRCPTQRSVAESNGNFPLNASRIPSRAVLARLQALLDAEEHVLYVEIGRIRNQTTSFGPVA
jgi:Endodeoxyribonuclease RusA